MVGCTETAVYAVGALHGSSVCNVVVQVSVTGTGVIGPLAGTASSVTVVDDTSSAGWLNVTVAAPVIDIGAMTLAVGGVVSIDHV